MERLSSQDSTDEPVSEDAVFDEVLGSRSAYRKGWGPLPKGVSRRHASSSHTENLQLKEQVRQLNESQQQYRAELSAQQEMMSAQQEIISQQQSVIDDLRLRSDEFTAFMRQFASGMQPGTSSQHAPQRPPQDP